tara:strand:+ start:2774 stop:3814 length:1041 start_codon:yes stop_codon:yes gene_type:complete
MITLNKLSKKKFSFFIRYSIIGIFSILLELTIRKFFLNFISNSIIVNLFPLIIGIIFAFISNISFNFKIPRYYLKKSFIYFSLISISSFFIQFLISKFAIFHELDYELSRFVISGLVFLVAYNFHIKFSFAKNKKVGVAIYLNDKENINDVFNKVGFYPDYIHIDFIDNTMSPNSERLKLNKFIEIKKKWPNHRIESHIMSKYPSQYIDKFSVYSDVIYFHNEINEDIDHIKNSIIKNNVIPGLVLHASKKYKDIEEIIKSFKEILILCIKNPGESGQNFLDKSETLIKEINNSKKRDKFNLCVDGGLTEENVNRIECEKIVSASNIFRNINPKRQIGNFQKLLNN